MVANKLASRLIFTAAICTAVIFSAAVTCARAQTAQQPSGQSNPDQSETGSSSSKPHHKSESSGTVRHTRVAEVDESSQNLAQAEALIQKHDYATAEPLLRKICESDGANYVAWFDLGFVENGMGKVNESIAAYRKSVMAKPDVFESNLNLGLQLAKTKQPDAEQFLRTATQLKPTSHVAEGQARAWLSLGHVLEGDKPEDALTAYHQAAVLQPADPEPHLDAGQLLENLSRFADAEQEYKAALALNPSADALTALANLSMRARRFPEASEYLRKLIALHPEDSVAHIELGRVLAAAGKNDEAIAELQTAAKATPGDLSIQRDLAELYTTANKPELAEGAYRALIAANPEDAESHHGLGNTLLMQKKFVDAEKEFLQAVKLKPDYGVAYGDLAFAASENKEYPLAIKALDLRAKTLPENANTYFLRGSAWDHLKDFKQAAANYHLFLKAANGKYPDQEWQAKHRLIAIEPKK